MRKLHKTITSIVLTMSMLINCVGANFKNKKQEINSDAFDAEAPIFSMEDLKGEIKSEPIIEEANIISNNPKINLINSSSVYDIYYLNDYMIDLVEQDILEFKAAEVETNEVKAKQNENALTLEQPTKSPEEVFKQLSIPDKIMFIETNYNLTYDELLDLVYGKNKDVNFDYEILVNYLNIINEEKLEYIFEKENLTKEQFDIVVAGVIDEAKDQGHCYIDAYGVINSIHNRTKSKRWNANYENGDNVYYQFVRPGQYSVYVNDTYKDHIGQTDVYGYQAVIDYLYSEDSITNFMSFNSWESGKSSNYLIEGGNRYFDELTLEDKLEKEPVLARTLGK